MREFLSSLLGIVFGFVLASIVAGAPSAKKDYSYCDPASTSFHLVTEQVDIYYSGSTPFMIIERI